MSLVALLLHNKVKIPKPMHLLGKNFMLHQIIKLIVYMCKLIVNIMLSNNLINVNVEIYFVQI